MQGGLWFERKRTWFLNEHARTLCSDNHRQAGGDFLEQGEH